MRRVARGVLRMAAAIVMAATLLGPAVAASANDGSEPLDPPLIQMIIIWLQGRFSVPGG